MQQNYITVFTPTYNRKDLLKRLYQSLLKQKKMNFEWLIIDDDSTDNTESMVKDWLQKEQPFPICYEKQRHGGKHRALNKGLKMAQGIYFFIVDSDDYLTEDATEKIERWGKEVEDRENIAGVSGLKVTPEENIRDVPDFGSNEWVEADNFDRGKYDLWGDKAEAYKTEILRKYPFPEFDGEYFVTEAVCWDAIAADGYKIRWYNTPVYIYEYLEGGLTKTGANSMSGDLNNYKGFCYYVSQCMRVKNIWGWTGNLRRYNKAARYLKKNWPERARDLNIGLNTYVYYICIVFPFVYTIKGFGKIVKLFGGLQKGKRL